MYIHRAGYLGGHSDHDEALRMMDEIIAYAFDDDGERHAMSLRDVYGQCAEMLKIMYFDGMIRGQGTAGTATYSYTKKNLMECLEIMLDRLNDKYADHIQDARQQVFGKAASLEGDTDG